MNAQTTQFDDLQLIALPTAVNCADLFVRFALTEWSLPRLKDEAAKVACEIVASAVDNSDKRAPGFITVRLQLRGDCLVIEVEDESSPHGALPEVLAGRRAGAEPLRDGGRLVWCEMPLPPGMTASEVPLPRRERRKPPVVNEPANAPVNGEDGDVDPEFFQRILFGLNRSPDGRPQ